jgi:hypothetical protein
MIVGTGCDQHVTGQFATLSGGYVGDIVSAVVTRYLEIALGVESAAAEEAGAHEHEHDTGALHDHEH